MFDIVRIAATLRNAIGITAVSICLSVAASSPAAAAPTPKVYLLRGFANVFSLGMDELAGKLQQRGIRTDVSNHSSWSNVVAEATADYKSGKTRPIILIGHSAGATAVVDAAEALGQAGVPVALAVTLDTNPRTLTNARVANFYNMYIVTGAFSTAKGFHGRLVNIDISKKGGDIGHFSIDKTNAIQAQILRYVAQAIGGSRPKPADAAAPKSASAPEGAGQQAGVAQPQR